VATFVMLSVVLLPVQAGPAEGGRTVRPRPAHRSRPLVAQQRTEDRGFSLTLTSPDEAYLVGPQVVTVEPVVPPGDVLERADFFIDGKLVFTDRVPPYAFQNDFSDEIRQHTIVVRARTLDGREARVSFVSRSADITDSAAGPIEVVPAVVRDSAGRPVVDLTVSDFSLLENGVSRPIIHFDSAPAPVSIIVALHDRDLDPDDRNGLLRSVADVGDDLPRHHALAFVDGAALSEPLTQDRATAALPFSHDRDEFRDRIAARRAVPAAGGTETLVDLLVAAAALGQRRGGRALLLMTGGPPPPPPPPTLAEAEQEPSGATMNSAEESVQISAPLTARRGEESTPPDAAVEVPAAPSDAEVARLQALRDALGALQRARVTINVLLAGNADPDSAEVALLREGAVESGGEFLLLAGDADPQEAFLRVSESLLHRYLISFQPQQPERGGDRAIDVRVRRSDLQVQAPTALSGE
jgi:hypothetical protein